MAVDIWLGRLANERRRSDHTIAAYRRDLDEFLRFLAEHRGGAPDLAALAALSMRDLRAWLARRAAEGRARTSTARALSAVRVFFRHLEREDVPVSSALSLVRAPRTPRGVPRPLTEGQAKAVVDPKALSAGPPDWIARRDTAVLLLLYGWRAPHRRGVGPRSRRRAGRRCQTPQPDDHGQGQQAAGGAGATGRGRSDRRLSRRLPAPAGARRSPLRRRARQAASAPPGAADDGAAARRARPAGFCDPARAPPQLRHPSARRRRRSAHDPGAPPGTPASRPRSGYTEVDEAGLLAAYTAAHPRAN